MATKAHVSPQTDQELFSDYLKTKNQDAFAVLYDRYFDDLVEFIFQRYIYNRASAEDVAQRAFMRLVQYGHTYNAVEPFNKWLFTIAGNVALSEAEAKNCQKRGGGKTTFRLDRENTHFDRPEDDDDDNNRKQEDELDKACDDGVIEVFDHKADEMIQFKPDEVFQALAVLTEDERTAINLHYYEHLGERDVARAMSISRHKVRLLLESANKRLRLRLDAVQLV